jgi:hypothetical protein
MTQLQGGLGVLEEMHPYLADNLVLSRLKIHLDDCQVNKMPNKTSIAFLPWNRGEKESFGDAFLNHNLQQLGLSIVGTFIH